MSILSLNLIKNKFTIAEFCFDIEPAIPSPTDVA